MDVGSENIRDLMPAAFASRSTNSGVETCSWSATRNTSKPSSASVNRCRMKEARFSTDRNAR